METVVIDMGIKSFGLYFADLRVKSGYRSQRELAEKSGVSHSTINRIEAGTHRATPDTLKAVAPYLKNTSYEELLKEAGIITTSAFFDESGRYRFRSDGENIDAEIEILLEKLEEKGSKLQARTMLRTASKMSKRQLEDILKVFEMIEADDENE